ncbi:asparagine synthetase B, partial [bacterium]|nr:asparagine synthetase B [bacterium]
IGAFLSGGIDSSSVVALMAKNVTGRIKTFSIGFKEQDFSELDFAKSVAEKYETEHFEKIVEPDCVSLLPKLVKAYDEPFADSSAIPTYYVSEFARQNVTVALSGDGGDELCAGYTSYPKFQKIGKYNLPLENFNKMFWGTLFNAIPEKVKGKGITYFLSKDRDEAQAYLGIFKLYERSSLFNEDVWNNAKKFPSEHFKVNLLRQSSSKDLLGRLQEMDLTSYMVDDILTKVDIASMQNSLEVRVPILDHKVAELFFKIPSDLRLKGDVGKYILKKSMNKYLPEKVLNHKKQGFALPFKLWFKKDLKDYTYDKLCDKNSKISNYLNINFLRKILNDHNSGMRDFNQKIWSVLFFAEWLEQNN